MWGPSMGGEQSDISKRGLEHLRRLGLRGLAVDSGAERFMHDLLWKVCSTTMPELFQRKGDEPFPGVPYQSHVSEAEGEDEEDGEDAEDADGDGESV